MFYQNVVKQVDLSCVLFEVLIVFWGGVCSDFLKHPFPSLYVPNLEPCSEGFFWLVCEIACTSIALCINSH